MHLSFCQQRGEVPDSFWLKASVLLQLSEVVQSEKQQKYDVWMLNDSENDINIVYGSLSLRCITRVGVNVVSVPFWDASWVE